MDKKVSWFKKTPRERTVQIWHLVCIGVGIIVCLVSLFVWKDYIFAPHKFRTEATLVKVDEKEEIRRKDKNDVNYSANNKYDTYYAYKLTWSFMNPDSELKYTYTTEDEASFKNAHSYGEKVDIYVYYYDDEADFELADPGASLVIGLAGLAIIVFPVVDIVRAAMKKRKIELRDRKNAEARAAGRMKKEG